MKCIPPGKHQIILFMGGETSFQTMWNIFIFFTSCHVVKKEKKEGKKKRSHILVWLNGEGTKSVHEVRISPRNFLVRVKKVRKKCESPPFSHTTYP